MMILLVDNIGLVDQGLLGIGPEKACLLFLLRSNAQCISNCEIECPSGGGSGMEELLLFSRFSGRSGEECGRFGVLVLRFVELD